MPVNVTPPKETASSREMFQFYRKVAARLSRDIEVDATTSDPSTDFTIWTDVLPESCVAYVHAVCLGITSSDTACFERIAKFTRATGAVTRHSIDTVGTNHNTGGFDFSVDTTGAADGSIEAVGDPNGRAVEWALFLRVLIKSL